MVKMCDFICTNLSEVLKILKDGPDEPNPARD